MGELLVNGTIQKEKSSDVQFKSVSLRRTTGMDKFYAMWCSPLLFVSTLILRTLILPLYFPLSKVIFSLLFQNNTFFFSSTLRGVTKEPYKFVASILLSFFTRTCQHLAATVFGFFFPSPEEQICYCIHLVRHLSSTRLLSNSSDFFSLRNRKNHMIHLICIATRVYRKKKDTYWHYQIT